jgi:hypothetical protein
MGACEHRRKATEPKTNDPTAASVLPGMQRDFESLLAAGNTQPGGFYRGGDAGAAEPDPPFGDATVKLFRGFVEDSVRGPTPRTPRSHVPPSEAPRPYAGANPKMKWEVTDDMMNQKWGQVLRTLDPAAANGPQPLRARPAYGNDSAGIGWQQLSPRKPTALVAPMGSARAYTHAKNGQRLAPAPGTSPRFSALNGPRVFTARPKFA